MTPSRIASLAVGRTPVGAKGALQRDTLVQWLQPGPEPRPPMLVNAEDETLERVAIPQAIRPTALAMLEEVTVHPGRFLVAGDAYVLESLNDSILRRDADLAAPVLPVEALRPEHRLPSDTPPARRLPDRVLPYAWVATFWWRNFGHWHIETLCALEFLEMAGLQATPLLPPLNAWQRASLLHAGWPPGRYIELPDMAPVAVRRLIFPSPAWLFQGGTLDLFGIAPQLCGWVRRIGAAVAAVPRPAGASPLPRRAFLARRGGSAINRPLANEAAVEAAFIARGYAPVTTDLLSYEDEVRLFAGAERIAGASGAAFALLPFARHGAHVVQLGTRLGSYYSWHGWASCLTALRHFAYHEHPALNGQGDDPGRLNGQAWSIDVPRLDRVLDRLETVWG